MSSSAKTSGLATLMVTLGAASLAVGSPTAAPLPHAVQAAPAPRVVQAAPAPRPADAAAVKQPAPASSAPAAKATSAKKLVPANMLKLPDSEMITVAGKQVSAGDVRRDIKEQILRGAGPPKLVRVASRKVAAAQTHMPMSASAAAMLGRSRQNEVAPSIVDCSQSAPSILKIEGSVASGQQFTLLGNCFGEQTGDVKIIGQFPGGNLHLTFAQWSPGHIVAALPAVSGTADQAVAISVINRDKRESPAKQANFVAARERVEVPERYWSPGTHFEWISDWGNYTWSNVSATTPMKFDVKINPECALDNIDVRASAGTISAVDGWSDGPPNASTVLITWGTQETITSYTFTVSDVVESSIFDVKAWANCPVGISP